jgi:single-stranded DNA-binding protein
MTDLNSIYLVGRLTVDSKIKSENDLWMSKFTLANNIYIYDAQKKEYFSKTNFLDIIVYGQENERVIKRLKKGMRIGVNGRINEEDGKIEIVCFTVQILDKEVISNGEEKE